MGSGSAGWRVRVHFGSAAVLLVACGTGPKAQDPPASEAPPPVEAADVAPSVTSGATARGQTPSESSLPGVSSAPRPTPADSEVKNELVVAPPDAIPDCAERLTKLGVKFKQGQLPLTQPRDGTFTCGAYDAVVYEQGPTGARLSPPALMTCRMALAFAEVEQLMQELARQHLGTEVQRVHHVGTYNCRKMVRFDYVSEHSYGNAIDLGSFTLKDGRKVSVLRHFGKPDQPPATGPERFLRELSSLAYDRGLVSVSLGPYWDPAHRDHFHLDMARYRVDGSRP